MRTRTEPPRSAASRPACRTNVRSETSCVLATCGAATVRPSSANATAAWAAPPAVAAAEVAAAARDGADPGWATRLDPPLAAPDSTTIRSDSERRYALTAGPGPTYAMSIDPAKSDSTACGPL